jgi:hypothetical protein
MLGRIIMNNQANELRLIANEMIHQLYQLGERDQLEILEIAARRSIEELDKQWERIKNAGE